MSSQLPEATRARRLANYTPIPDAGCWIWLGKWNSDGYGEITSNGRYFGTAHAYFYRAYIGEIPRGATICHRCDTPSCVNPSHLFVGTQADNMRDMAAKGRGVWQKRDAARAGSEGAK